MNTDLETNLKIDLEIAFKLDSFQKNKFFFFFTFFNTDLETNLKIDLETVFNIDRFQKKQKFFFFLSF